jgi:hypothetical protein
MNEKKYTSRASASAAVFCTINPETGEIGFNDDMPDDDPVDTSTLVEEAAGEGEDPTASCTPG